MFIISKNLKISRLVLKRQRSHENPIGIRSSGVFILKRTTSVPLFN